MRATLLRTQGDYLEAVIEIDGEQLVVMDNFEGSRCSEGTSIDIDLQPVIIDPGDWDTVFGANPGRSKGLLHLTGWSYIALGQILSVDPVTCDCGLLSIVDAIRTHDARCVGAYVGIKIDRLDAIARQ